MGLGEALQAVYEGVKRPFSRKGKAQSSPKKKLLRNFSKVAVGGVLIDRGAWLTATANWGFDWAQYSKVNVPWPNPIDHLDHPGWGWWLYNLGLGVSGLALMYLGGKMVGKPLGYYAAKGVLPELTEEETKDVERVVGRRQIKRYAGMALGVSAFALSTALYFHSGRFNVNTEYFGWSYGQLWNLLQVGPESVGNDLLTAGFIYKGLRNGWGSYKKEATVKTEKAPVLKEERPPLPPTPSFPVSPLSARSPSEAVQPLASPQYAGPPQIYAPDISKTDLPR